MADTRGLQVKWFCSSAGILFVALLLIMPAPGLQADTHIRIIDPHTRPENCISCHSSEPTEVDVENGEYRLLGDSIDNTCHICHPYDCCRINSLKRHNHAIGLDDWDKEKFKEPEALPLYAVKITCLTCHYHKKPETPDYKMIRLVSVELEKVDWTALCVDCHQGY